MGVPQICYIVLLALDLGICLARHGEPRKENYNIFASLIGTAIQVGLLKLGGFF